ncbi:hypothetical protein ACVNF4_05610 [Streptomyces sp. S6]
MRIEEPPMIFRHHTFGSRHRIIALAVGMTLSLCACTKESGENRPPRLSADQVCDGALDTEGRAALTRLSDVKEFEELTGKNDAGEPSKFSLVRATKHLHDRYEARSRCDIYKTGKGNDFPFVSIDFMASEHSLKPSKEGRPKSVLFNVGSYAAVTENGALLYFNCATKGSAGSFVGDTPYVKGDMYSTSSAARDPRDRMVILNSLARAVAEKLGCTAEADLPAKVPTPSA